MPKVAAKRATAAPHPESVIRAAGGRLVQLKAHRCLWSGAFPENSLPAVEECYRAGIARAEIDLHMLRDGDFLVLHDAELGRTTTGSGLVGGITRREAQSLRLAGRRGVTRRVSALRPPLFGEVAALIHDLPPPTIMELDLREPRPLPWPRVEELVRLIEPIRDRIVFNGFDWNLRRLLTVDATLPVGYDPGAYLDWATRGSRAAWESRLPRGAYGYLDAHPLARRRLAPVADYLAVRIEAIALLVPGAREAHVRLAAFERMLDDGAAAADLFHRRGERLDVWTLNAGTPRWRERLARALDAGVDIVTSDTPRALALAAIHPA